MKNRDHDPPDWRTIAEALRATYFGLQSLSVALSCIEILQRIL